MFKQLAKVGTIRREFLGKACHFCGGRTYQVIVRTSGASHGAGLSARCSHCQRSRGLNDDLGRLLWM
jgi:hypothetical protein